tara:strand:+ start:2440 stop:2916 length:477 start_codon:yes stop_codon:yes gene_type:complete
MENMVMGGCICGEVKYKINKKPLFTQACHCKDCKIITGSSFVVNTSILDNSLEITGELSSGEIIAGSGKKAKIYFCKKCGVYIYSDYESAIGRLTVRTKTFSNPEHYPPQAHIFVKNKDTWITLSDEKICFEEMYDPKIMWPKDSQERYRAYLETSSK